MQGIHLKPLTYKNWRIPLLGGFLLPILLWGCLRLIYPPINPEVVAAARRLGIEPRIYNDVSNMLEKAEKAQDIPEPDWLRLKHYLSDPNVNLQNEVLGVFSLMRRSAHRDEIRDVGRRYVNGNQQELKVEALIVLWKLKDPTWRNEAMKMANTQDAQDREVITHMLAKGERP